MQQHFSDKVIAKIKLKQSFVIVGIDLSLNKLPKSFINKYNIEKSTKDIITTILVDYAKKIIDATCEYSIGIKIQSAYFEQYYIYGIKAIKEISDYAKSKDLIVIFDGKRNDISSTAEAYANSYIGSVDIFGVQQSFYEFDAMTVNPYLGSDSIIPFINECQKNNKGLFILVKTSNPSSAELQNLIIDGKHIYEIIASKVNDWGKNLIGYNGYSDIGAVVGALDENAAKNIREILPKHIFLVPGIGAQGGDIKALKYFIDSNNNGIIVNSSRDIIYAYMKEDTEDFEKSANKACKDLRDRINSIL
ncbi:orotidine-5'-phosphate decarboxylase [Caldicellulosiruptoraceae bacterium PP1]